MSSTPYYMDGRLIEIVLKDKGFSCLSRELIHVDIAAKTVVSDVKVINGLTVFRVVTYGSHSSLLFVDGTNAWWWNPRAVTPLTSEANTLMRVLVYRFIVSRFGVTKRMVELKQDCPIEGMCNAYVLKYLLDWMEDSEFSGSDSSDIREFASTIARKYSHLLSSGDEEIEYGMNEGGMLVGSAGGMLMGGMLGGVGGMLAGGVLGGAIGANSPRRHSLSDARACH